MLLNYKVFQPEIQILKLALILLLIHLLYHNHKNLNLFCAGFTKAYQAKNEISQFLEFWGLWDRSQLTSERERRMLQNELFQAKKPRRYGRERSL